MHRLAFRPIFYYNKSCMINTNVQGCLIGPSIKQLA